MITVAHSDRIAVRLTKPSNADGNKPYCVIERIRLCALSQNRIIKYSRNIHEISLPKFFFIVVIKSALSD